MQPSRDALLARTRFVPSFPTPVYKLRLPEAARINPELKETVLAMERRYPSKGYSNFGGWHSGYGFADWGGASLQELLAAARKLAARATRTRQRRLGPEAWDIKCWANVIRRGHANDLHTHVGCYWSGAYYVSVGAAGNRPEIGGQLVFHDPRNGAVTLELPAAGGPQSHPVVAPEEGVLVMFPSWLPHSVTPYFGDDVRISIGVNLALSPEARGLLA